LPQSFLLLVIVYLFALSLRDYMVTGVLAKGLEPDGRFHAYVLVTSLEVLTWATYALISEPIPSFIGALKFVTVLACWVGGPLDWIYFIAKGEIPAWDHVWHWMPGKPKTWQWGIWTLCWLVGLGICWSAVLVP